MKTKAATKELHEARARLAHARKHIANRAWRAAHRTLDRAELLANRIAYTARKARRAKALERKAKRRFKLALKELDHEISQARWRAQLVTHNRRAWRVLVVTRRARAEALQLAKKGDFRPATAKLKSATKALERWQQRRYDRRAALSLRSLGWGFSG